MSNTKEEKGVKIETKLKQLFQIQVCSNDCSLSALCGAFYVQSRDSKARHISSKCIFINASNIFIHENNIFIY